MTTGELIAAVVAVVVCMAILSVGIVCELSTQRATPPPPPTYAVADLMADPAVWVAEAERRAELEWAAEYPELRI